MRYPPEETARRHQALIEAAAALFRERGIAEVSVSEVMKAAGMTHGAFPSHFINKDELASAAIHEAMRAGDATFEKSFASDDPKNAFLSDYLSGMHRDHAGQGCVMAALASEIGRRGKDRPALSGHIRRLIDRAANGFNWKPRSSKRNQAILMTSAMVGAMILARSVDDPALSEEIISATRSELLAATYPPRKAAQLTN